MIRTMRGRHRQVRNSCGGVPSRKGLISHKRKTVIQALDWLDRAYDAHDVHLVLLDVDPKWDVLRADTRLPVLIERCGFDPIRRPSQDAGLLLAG